MTKPIFPAPGDSAPRHAARRDFLRKSAGAMGALSAAALLPASIQRALAISAAVETGTIQDVKHVVILMQENRAFNHYFGAMRGVRGFGDRFPIPLASGKSVWFQSDGTKEVPPYHLDRESMNAIFVPGTPHSFSDAQAAWNQGKFGFWPQYKNVHSMGYYRRTDIPFQYALAEAFTICDGYHCSITTGTDPNRIVFWSGSNFNPELGRLGINCTDSDSEPNNLRCWITGALPEPGYTYQGSSFKWPTLPDLLEKAGVSWRFYQDPNNNWTGAMHGGLAFESFRTAEPGSPLYEKGMSHYSLEALTNDVRNNTLPEVSWVLPSPPESEHPGGGGSTSQGADYISRVLDALTANPEVWAKTAFFITFDENDGLFDHLPPPAVPSYDADGKLMGKSTVALDGEYFSDPARKYLKADDTISGTTRPWGLGPRVPMYVISPWSRGGWVSSEAFDHTSVGRFLEKRFGITVDSISPWHRAVCGDLTSAFDFETPNDPSFPTLPDNSDYAAQEAQQRTMPRADPPLTPQPLYQEPGTRYSRALPYELHVSARVGDDGRVKLIFSNTGKAGAVFHVYDKNHLDLIPRRYTVEAGKMLEDDWDAPADGGDYDLWVYGTNGFVRTFSGNSGTGAKVEAQVCYDVKEGSVYAKVANNGTAAARVTLQANAYRTDGPWALDVPAGQVAEQHWVLADSGNWYDFTLEADGLARRFAGRVETGSHTVSDPAMATTL
ncbi:phosphocholine-specific phospholipase C [Bordetella sp. BOR01]|uniref:phosphocholine-specific phospholipase C n=1 Tax=Bordetella sp. BOR01 TaxID=2854779 RepID=UPI001C474819|nr:phospholipase C, phosphocholine-specific [Bordetella sp. BOR01]MBV7485535.1 phospholipase C, phosphocholine-specific [Bordetella sp. BOR01]